MSLQTNKNELNLCRNTTGLRIFAEKYQHVHIFWLPRQPKTGHDVSPSAEEGYLGDLEGHLLAFLLINKV